MTGRDALRYLTPAIVIALTFCCAHAGPITCPVIDTGQKQCYGLRGPIACPGRGQPYFGQDAQYRGIQPAYRDNGDGTVTDLNTGLMWQKTPDYIHRSWHEAARYADSLSLAGYTDWRLPTIKELFSITDFRGTIHKRRPYLNTRYFDFRYPDTSKGHRIIDAQYWSSNRYLGTTMFGDSSAFGFNFADGRIKSYPMVTHDRRRSRKGIRPGKQVRCVRGPVYGKNDFVDNGDGTISDRATGLMWMKSDSSRPMRWPAALAYAEELVHAGYDDWRLPNVKELQSIVDYGRAPDSRDPSARGPAIDPVFDVTKTESWYWTSTTHVETLHAYYVAFGRALSALKRNGRQVNAHGAGAVRSAPKSGSASMWPNGLGPQRDEVRPLNYVRCVRGGTAKLQTAGTSPAAGAPGPQAEQSSREVLTPQARFIRRHDSNGDGKVSRSEFHGPRNHFSGFDRDHDGFISQDEAPLRPPPRRGPPAGRHR